MSDSCLNNIDLCGHIASYLGVSDLLILEIVSKIWTLPISRAFSELRRSDSYHYLTYKSRNDYPTDKRITNIVFNNRKHGAFGLLVFGGSFGPHDDSVLLNDCCDTLGGEIFINASLPASFGSNASTIDKDGNVILIGGWDDEVEKVSNWVLSLDVKSDDMWGRSPSLCKPRSFCAATSTIHGDIVVMGGGDTPYRGASTYNDCEILRYSATEWNNSSIPNMNCKRCGHSAVTLFNDSIIVLGGYTRGSEYLSSVELLDANFDRWITLPSMSVSRSGMATVLGPYGSVYVTGGSSDGMDAHKRCERFDPREGKRFYSVGDMNIARGYTAGCIGSRECFYVSGGIEYSAYTEGMEYFDFKMNKWTMIRSKSVEEDEVEDDNDVLMDPYLLRACHQMLYIM